jgi:hypothetical protein
MKIAKIKSSVYKRVLGIFGAAGFLVTFQACYGTPQNYVFVEGSISDSDTEAGIAGLQVNIVTDTDSMTLTTDSLGNFYSGIISENRNLQISITDIDGEANGSYIGLDTALNFKDQRIDIKLSKE